MNVNINEEKPKLTLQEKRCVQSIPWQLTNNKTTKYIPCCLTQHLVPSCDWDQAGVDWTLSKSQAGREPDNDKRSWKIFIWPKFEPYVQEGHWHALLRLFD